MARGGRWARWNQQDSDRKPQAKVLLRLVSYGWRHKIHLIGAFLSTAGAALAAAFPDRGGVPGNSGVFGVVGPSTGRVPVAACDTASSASMLAMAAFSLSKATRSIMVIMSRGSDGSAEPEAPEASTAAG